VVTSEATPNEAMVRLMVRHLARGGEFPNSFSTHSGE